MFGLVFFRRNNKQMKLKATTPQKLLWGFFSFLPDLSSLQVRQN